MEQSSLLTMIFGRTLVDLGRRHKDLVVVDASLAKATRTAYFAAAFPDRFVDVGYSEGDLFGTAAGLASAGMRVFVGLYATLLGRCWDQIAQSICLPRLPVRIVGTHAGFNLGPEGAPRQSLFDVALARALPNLAIVSPADEDECRQAIEFAATYDEGPLYIRLGTAESAKVRGFDSAFRLGWPRVLAEGTDVALVSAGAMLELASQAARKLTAEGISTRLIHCSTLRPLNEELIAGTARHTGALVTVEEHSILGGLGSAVAEVLARSAPVPLETVGVPHGFGESGSTHELMQKHGLTVENVVRAAHRAIERKK